MNPSPSPAMTGILLAGGKSTRMGTPKVNLPFDNMTFGVKALQLLKQFCETILISQNQLMIDFESKSVSDIYPDIGPMGGLHACLSASQTPWNLVLACDLPQVQTQTILPLIEHRQQHQAVCYLDGQFSEPLCAIYHRNTLVEIEKCITNGEYSLQKLLENLDTCFLPVDELIRSQLRNINTPADLLSIQK